MNSLTPDITAATVVQHGVLDPETGAVVWPGGPDLAPDTLYERVRSGAWPQSRAAA